MEQLLLRIRRIRPSVRDDEDAFKRLYTAIARAIGDQGAVYTRYVPPPTIPETGGGGPWPIEVLVTLVGSGTATAVVALVVAYLRKHSDRELSLETKDKKIAFKGHSLAEERSLIAELFPEALEAQPRPEDEAKNRRR